jgi:hypothetical protein
VNVAGIQLDHQQSWDRIASTMTQHNLGQRRGGVTDAQSYYTVWDAKMYYNDQPNLVPALGGLNAAAGARGVDLMPRIHYGLESTIGTLQTSWMNLQAGLTAVGDEMNESGVFEVAESLLAMARRMNEITDKYL